jgi:serine/threonine protein kinase
LPDFGNQPDFEKTRLSVRTQSGETSEFFTSPNLVGTVFEGRFRVDTFLGAGGSGQVYKCTDLPMQRSIALKVLSGHLDAKTIRRFQTEAIAISRLDHPNLVSIHEFGLSQNGQPFIVMEFIEGQSLAELLKKAVRLEPVHCIELFLPVFEALQGMHDKGVIHRDLKPGNIIVSSISSASSKQIAKIVDFGIAKILSENAEGQPQLTQTGEIFGSPLYMSPEQACGTKIDSRTDQYSLGCLIFECLTGTTPHVGKTSIETLLKHQSENAPSLREASMGEKFPVALEEVVAKLLAKEPTARFSSMAKAQSAFKNCLVANDNPTGKGRHETTSDKRSTNSKLIIACCVFAILIVVGFAFELLKKNNNSSTPPVVSTKAITARNSTSSAKSAAEAISSEFGTTGIKVPDPAGYPDAEMPTNDVAFIEFMYKYRFTRDIRVNPEVSDDRISKEKFLVFNRDIDKGAMKGFESAKQIKNLMILNCPALGDDGMDHIMHLPLEDVNLTGSQVGDLTAKKLLKIKTLKGLVLRATRITDNAFTDAAPNLNHLLIADTKVDDAGCALLPAFKKLEYIDLAGTKITDAGIKYLSRLSLNGLWISRTGITDSAGDFIANIKGLRTLDISETHVSDAFLKKIGRAKNLGTLYIQKCDNLSPEGIDEFHKKNPGCIIVQEARENFKFFAKD